MNAFNKRELQKDKEGLLESCDCCNSLIYNWEHISQAFLSFDGEILCLSCRTEYVKKNVAEKNFFKFSVDFLK